MRHFTILLFIFTSIIACKKEDKAMEATINPCENVSVEGMPPILWEKNIAPFDDANFVYSIPPIQYRTNYILSRSLGLNPYLLLVDSETGTTIWEKEVENSYNINQPIYLHEDKLYWNNLFDIVELDLITLQEKKINSTSNRFSEMSYFDYPNYVFTERDDNVVVDSAIQHLKILNLETEEITVIHTDTLSAFLVNFGGIYLFSHPILWQTDEQNLVSFLKLTSSETPFNSYNFLTIDINSKEVIVEKEIIEPRIKSMHYYPVQNDFLLNFDHSTISVKGLTGNENWKILPSPYSIQIPESPLHHAGPQLLTGSGTSLRFTVTADGREKDAFFHVDNHVGLDNAIILSDSEELLILYRKGVALLDYQTGCIQMEFDGSALIDGYFDHLLFHYNTYQKQLLIGKGANVYCFDMSAF